MSTEIRSLGAESFDGEDNTVERYEIWQDDQLVLMLDLFDGEFSAEWFAPYSATDFVQNLREAFGVTSETDALAMYSPPEREDDQTRKGPLGAVIDTEYFPTDCTYLEVTLKEALLEVAWAADNPNSTLMISGSSDDFHFVKQLFRDSSSGLNIPEEATEEIISKADERVSGSQTQERTEVHEYLKRIFKN